MGDLNQFTLVSRMADQLAGPFLEIGSKNYGSTQDLRSLLSSQGKYVGVDMEAGTGVDLVLDMTQNFADIERAFGGERFGTIVCLSVLEHCDQPFRMAENMTRLLKPGGRVVISAPFVWKFHGYPSDYWRFTHEGIKKLFPSLAFDMEQSIAAGARENAFSPLNEEIGKISFSSKAQRRQGHLLRGITVGILRTLARIGLLRWLAGDRYLMAPTCVFMTGTLPLKPESRAA